MQIAIDQDRDLAADRLQTGENGRALSGIFFEVQNPGPRIGCDPGTSFVLRTIVHKNDFVIEPGERVRQFALQHRDALLFVVKRNNYRDVAHSGSVRYRRQR